MDILAAIKREERKLEKQLGKLQQRWNGVRAAAKVLGDSTNRFRCAFALRVSFALYHLKSGSYILCMGELRL
jgi:hypothetical protein